MTGFSVRRDIVNKATEAQAKTLHKDWKWITNGTPHRMLKALCLGYAVTPGKWSDAYNRKGEYITAYKSKLKGNFEEAWYVMLDFDNAISVDDALNNEFIASTASFLYTSPSHKKPGKGERFRVVWHLSEPVYEAKHLDYIIRGIRRELGNVDDPAINSASCLFGSQPLDDNFFAHVFGGNHKLDPQPWIDAEVLRIEQRRKELEERGIVAGECWQYDEETCGEDRVALMIHCLKEHEDGVRYIPVRSTTHGTYDYCKDVVAGLVHYFGVELTYKIIDAAEWHGEWDIDHMIEVYAEREEDWEPGIEPWCSYTTVLKLAGQELTNYQKTWKCPAMPKADFHLFKNDTNDVNNMVTDEQTNNLEVSDSAAQSLGDHIDLLVKLELSDNTIDNHKATILFSQVAKQFSIPPQKLQEKLHKAAMAHIGVDLYGSKSTINVDPTDSGWDFDEESEDAMEYLIPGVLPLKGTTAIAAVGGVGKNKLVAYYGYRCVEGLPCIPHPEFPVKALGKKILFIATDQAGSAKRRIASDFRDAGADNEWLMKNVKIIACDSKRGEPAWTATTRGFHKLKQLMDSDEFGLVIIDSLKTITAGTEFCMSDNNDMSLMTRTLMTIVNDKASMIIINHAAEPTKKIPTINEMQTATAFGQMIDAVFILRKPAEGGYYREMYGVKIRDNNEGVRINYTPNIDTGELDMLPGMLSPEAKRGDEILKIIQDGKAKPTSAKTIATTIGMPIHQVSNYLTKANSARLIRPKGNKAYVITAAGKRHLKELTSKTFIIKDGTEGGIDF